MNLSNIIYRDKYFKFVKFRGLIYSKFKHLAMPFSLKKDRWVFWISSKGQWNDFSKLKIADRKL